MIIEEFVAALIIEVLVSRDVEDAARKIPNGARVSGRCVVVQANGSRAGPQDGPLIGQGIVKVFTAATANIKQGIAGDRERSAGVSRQPIHSPPGAD